MGILPWGADTQMEASMKMILSKASIAVLAFVCTALLWTDGAEARARLYVTPYAANAWYHPAADLSWYAVRAYYFGGPWSGPYYSYTGWQDYATRNGIGCEPGTIVHGGDGIYYNCQ
jgi:hypothetical protein